MSKVEVLFNRHLRDNREKITEDLALSSQDLFSIMTVIMQKQGVDPEVLEAIQSGFSDSDIMARIYSGYDKFFRLFTDYLFSPDFNENIPIDGIITRLRVISIGDLAEKQDEDFFLGSNFALVAIDQVTEIERNVFTTMQQIDLDAELERMLAGGGEESGSSSEGDHPL